MSAPATAKLSDIQNPPALVAAIGKLDREQRAAAQAILDPSMGNLRLAACAGAGKTGTVTVATAAVVTTGVYAPQDVVVTTFTSKAGKEIQHRIGQYLSQEQTQALRLGTFHGLALRALRAMGQNWSMPFCLDIPNRADNIPSSGLLWSFVTGWGDIKGTGHQGLNLDLMELGLQARDYQMAADLIRAHDGHLQSTALIGKHAEHLPRFREAWELYEACKAELQAWDFADALAEWLRLLRAGDGGAKLVIVDEAQDNNLVQLEIGKLLASNGKGRLVLVGDPAQCIPQGQMVSTPRGPRPVESIRPGDFVLSSVGGQIEAQEVVHTSTSVHSEAFEFTTETGATFQATKEHVLFAALGEPDGYYVYLMWRHDGYGFRVGCSQSTGKQGLASIKVRTQQENGERLWILAQVPDKATAHRMEHALAYRYRVPMAPFVPRPGTMFATTEEAQSFFAEFALNGHDILNAFDLDFDRPAYVAKSSNRGRVAVNVVLSTRKGYSEVGVESANVPEGTAARFDFIRSSRGTQRFRKYPVQASEALDLAKQVAGDMAGLGYVTETLSLPGADRRAFAVNAAGVHPGFFVPEAQSDGSVKLVKVISRRVVPVSVCYDLQVNRAANFIVGGIVVHNSIYRFRGAYPEFFLHADGEELAAKTFLLPNNYRSGAEIVQAGNRVIQGQSWALGEAKPARGGGKGIVQAWKVGAGSPGEEALDVATEIANELLAGRKPDEFAIITRTNAAAGEFQAACVAQKIPSVVVGGTPFFQRKEVQDFVAYAILAFADARPALERIVNRPKRYLGKAFVAQVGAGSLPPAIRAAGRHQRSAAQRNQADRLADLIEKLRTLPWSGGKITAPEVIRKTLAPEQGQGRIKDGDDDRIGLYGVVASIAERFTSAREFVEFAARCESQLAQAEAGDVPQGKVVITTTHRAKGLEYPRVYVSASNGVFPHRRSETTEQQEEERRLFYVAVTRGRESVTGTWSTHDQSGKPLGPSPFLAFLASKKEEA